MIQVAPGLSAAADQPRNCQLTVLCCVTRRPRQIQQIPHTVSYDDHGDVKHDGTEKGFVQRATPHRCWCCNSSDLHNVFTIYNPQYPVFVQCNASYTTVVNS